MGKNSFQSREVAVATAGTFEQEAPSSKQFTERIVGLVDGRIVTDVETAAFDAKAFIRVYGLSADNAASSRDL